MSLAPSKIMAWQFTKELGAKKLNRDSYSQWRANEESAKQRSEKLKEQRRGL